MNDTIQQLVQHVCNQDTFDEDAAFTALESIIDYGWQKKLIQLIGRLAETLDPNTVVVCQDVMVFDQATGRISHQDESGNVVSYWDVGEMDYDRNRQTYFPKHSISEHREEDGEVSR